MKMPAGSTTGYLLLITLCCSTFLLHGQQSAAARDAKQPAEATRIAAAPQAKPPSPASQITDKSTTTLYLHGFAIATTKTYDGTTTIAILDYGTLNTEEDGSGTTPDNVTLETDGATATTTDADAGSNKAVTVTGLSLSGDDSNQYDLQMPSGLTTTILPRPVTHDGQLTIQDKPYDQTTTAVIAEWGAIHSNDIIGDDDVALLEDPQVTTAAFEDPDIGDDKTVYVYNLSLTGTDAGNYTLSSPPLPPGHGGGDDFMPPALYATGNIVEAPFAVLQLEGPATITAGETTTGYTLSTYDAFGNVVTAGETITITLASGSASTGDAVAFDPSPVALAPGSSSATFSYMDQEAGVHTLTATVTDGVRQKGTISATFAVTVTHADAAALRFEQQPQTIAAGEAFSPAPTVTVEDAFGNQATTATHTITLSLQISPFRHDQADGNADTRSPAQYRDPAALKGTLSVQATDGHAAFDNVWVEQAGDDYQIEARTSGLQADLSDPFNITAAATHELVFSSFPGSHTAGNDPVNYAVLRRDAFGNQVTDGDLEVYLYHDSGEDLAAFYSEKTPKTDIPGGDPFPRKRDANSRNKETPITSITIADTHTSAGFRYADKQAGDRTITASGNSEAPDGDNGIHDAVHILHVAPRPITVRVEDATREYGTDEAEHSFRDFSSELMEGDTQADITGGSGGHDEVTYETQTNAGSPVGSYPYDIGILSSSWNGTRAGSYDITTIKGMTTIGTKTLTIGGSLSAEHKNYDGTVAAVVDTDGLTLPGKVDGDDVGLEGVEAVFSDAAAGTRTVTITEATLAGDDAGNYTLSHDIAPETTAEILEAPLTVTAEDQYKVIDGDVFPGNDYTAAYDGFVGDEDSSVLGGTLSFGGDALTATDVGTYTITVSGHTADNYEVTYEEGQLHITGKSFVFEIQPANTTAGQVIAGHGESGKSTKVGTENALRPAGKTPQTAGKTAAPDREELLPITIHIVDEDNNILNDADDTVTISLGDNPGGGTLSGTLTRQAQNGVVTFDDLEIRAAGEGYTLRASAPQVATGSSNPFDIFPAEADKLLFTEAPESITAGVTTLAFSIEVHDTYGNPTTGHDGFTDLVSVAGTGEAAGSLTPDPVDLGGEEAGVSFQWSPPVAAGTYTFTLQPGAGYDAVAHGAEIHHAPASRWHFATALPETATAGEEFDPQAVIHVTDEYGNLATTYEGSQFVATLDEAAGGSLIGSTTAQVSSGVAAFGAMSYERAATITLTFSANDEAISPEPAGMEEVVIDVSAAAPATLSLEQHPVAPGNIFDAGNTLEPHPIVLAEDSYGNPVPGAEITAATCHDGLCPDSGWQVHTDATGEALFDNLVINEAGNDIEVRFAADGDDGTLWSEAFIVHVRPNTPASTAIIAGPTSTIPGDWSDDYTLILLDDYDNESYAMGNMVFDMESSSGEHDFRAGGRGDIMIPSGLATTTFQYIDHQPGVQTLTASWSLAGKQEGTEATGSRQHRSLPPAEYQVEVTDEWVWMAREDHGKDNDWFDAANWNQDVGVPGPDNTVYIRTYHADIAPRIDGAASVDIGTLVMESALPLHLAPDAALSVKDFIHDSGPEQPAVIIESDAGNTGSFIHDKEAVYGRVERHIGGEAYDWHMLSAPVGGQPIAGEGAADFTGSNFFTWYEPEESWVGYGQETWSPTWSEAHSVGGVTHTFIPGRGYMASYAFDPGQNPVKRFEGPLGYGSQDVSLMHYADGPYSGFTLAGNPYPSAIDWKDNTGWGGRDHLETTDAGYDIWIWNPAKNNYGVYNSAQDTDAGTLSVTRFIPSMQAFWVRSASGAHGQELSMNGDVRVHDPGEGWMKEEGGKAPVLRLAVDMAGECWRDEVLIEFGHPEGAVGAAKLFSLDAGAPGLYTVRDDAPLAISFLTHPSAHREVPLAFRVGRDDQYTLTAHGVQSIGDDVYLVDRFTGTETLLGEGSAYVFFAAEHDNPERFVLRFGAGGEATGTAEADSFGALIHYAGGMLHVANPWDRDAGVQVFDTRGGLVDSFDAGAGSITRRLFGRDAGVYVVRMQDGRQRHTEKIVVGY